MTKLAVIGTAGRKTDAAFLSKESYGRMVKGTIELIHHLGIDPDTLELVSGGAAWADHIVVTLCKMGIVPYERLTIFLPCPLAYSGYDEGNDKHKTTAGTANHYHRMFTNAVGFDSIKELVEARLAGATFDDESNGFHHRNSKVAGFLGEDGHVLAYTFGGVKTKQPFWSIRSFPPEVDAQQAGLKDGGTAHTWGRAKCFKHHGNLGPMETDYIGI